MGKTVVFTWRIAPETREALDRVARREGRPVAAVLDRMAAAWLRREVRKGLPKRDDVSTRERALSTLGTIAGGDPTRSQRVRDRVRARLRDRRAR